MLFVVSPASSAGDVPPEIIDQIISHLEDSDSWDIRNVSGHNESSRHAVYRAQNFIPMHLSGLLLRSTDGPQTIYLALESRGSPPGFHHLANQTLESADLVQA